MEGVQVQRRGPRSLPTGIGLLLLGAVVQAQVDPVPRNALQLGYDQGLEGRGPQAIYAYYYLNLPAFTRTNLALRLAIAPAYVDGELGIRGVLTPHTALGLGVAGGAFGENYYEVRQGDYIRNESMYGHGGGAAISIYHRLNPGQRIPLHGLARAGAFYSTYAATQDTADSFVLPDERMEPFVRVGLRWAGKEPVLYPDLGLEASIWFERHWRFGRQDYGFAGDRRINEQTDLYWLHLGLNYAWTNTGHKVEVAVTAGGSNDADRFSSWRLGGVLPLVAEFPLILPGYYYQEISAERFVHLQAGYVLSLDRQNCWKVRFEAASARVDYLPGFEQPGDWLTGVGGGLTYTSRNKVATIALRYGFGFNALRDGDEGAHSVGILFQYDWEASAQVRKRAQ